MNLEKKFDLTPYMCAYTCVYVIYIYKIFIDLYLVINSTSYATPFPRLTIKDKKKNLLF